MFNYLSSFYILNRLLNLVSLMWRVCKCKFQYTIDSELRLRTNIAARKRYTAWHTCKPTYCTLLGCSTLDSETVYILNSLVDFNHYLHPRLRLKCTNLLLKTCLIAFWFCWGWIYKWYLHRDLNQVSIGNCCCNASHLFFLMIYGGDEVLSSRGKNNCIRYCVNEEVLVTTYDYNNYWFLHFICYFIVCNYWSFSL